MQEKICQDKYYEKKRVFTVCIDIFQSAIKKNNEYQVQFILRIL